MLIYFQIAIGILKVSKAFWWYYFKCKIITEFSLKLTCFFFFLTCLFQFNCDVVKFSLGLTCWLLTIPVGLLFVCGNCIAYPFEERITSAKHLQLMTGLSPIIYWGATYIADFIIYCFFALLLPIPFFFVELYRGTYIYFKLKEMGKT